MFKSNQYLGEIHEWLEEYAASIDATDLNDPEVLVIQLDLLRRAELINLGFEKDFSIEFFQALSIRCGSRTADPNYGGHLDQAKQALLSMQTAMNALRLTVQPQIEKIRDKLTHALQS